MDQSNTSALLSYYSSPGPITTFTGHDDFLRWLTGDIRAIFQVVQGLLIHGAWANRCGASFDLSKTFVPRMATMQDLLDHAAQASPLNLALPHSPDQRVFCCCREFATLFCAILRYKGIPARSRCGFSTYLAWPGYYEDHWVCEYWLPYSHQIPEEGRWVTVDPQLDPFQQSFLQADFSPLDVPSNRFISAGKAWNMCRSEGFSSDRFGISDDPKTVGLDSLYGLWFVRGNLLRDFAALNKVETVPLMVRLEQRCSWQPWRLVAAGDEDLTARDWALLDRIAALSLDPDHSFEEIRALFQTEPDLQPPAEILEPAWY